MNVAMNLSQSASRSRLIIYCGATSPSSSSSSSSDHPCSAQPQTGSSFMYIRPLDVPHALLISDSNCKGKEAEPCSIYNVTENTINGRCLCHSCSWSLCTDTNIS